jgi:ankyrin repeat protein
VPTIAVTPIGYRSLLALACAWSAAGVANAAEIAAAAMARDMETVRALVREGADPNASRAYGAPALQWAVHAQDVDTAKVLLEAGADPNSRSSYGVAPLHLAVTNGNLELARLLLEAGAEPDVADASGETPLFIAARLDEVGIARLLLEHGAEADRRQSVDDEQTPLFVAAREGSVATARLLLEHGAEVNAQTAVGPTPTMRLPGNNTGSKGAGINRGGHPDHGVRPAIQGAKSPLVYATRHGDLAMVQLLLEAGADIEGTDANGITPLINVLINASVASVRKDAQHFASARYLIERGANVNAADWYGQTPLWVAIDARNIDVTGYYIATRDNGMNRDEALDVIKLLIDRGADVNARTQEYMPDRRFILRLGSLSWVDFTGQTPFLRAALAGDVTVMRLLLEHGADPNIATFGGTTPLMAAAGVNWVYNQTFDEGPDALLEAVKLAHSLGNDVNAVNSMGINAVHGAANRGSNDIIQYLVGSGAVLNVADDQGRTPVTWAEGVFLATHPPIRKPETIALLEQLQSSHR